MRQLKFKFWDKSKNEFVKNLMIKENGEVASSNPEHYDILQFTGLFDKQGIEIYEGDYLLDGHSGGRGEVKFYKGAFIVEFDNEMQDLYDWTYEYVIGNIYEDSHLLDNN